MKKGEIWLVDLPTTEGREQSGTRPVVLLVETEANISIIIPLTSNVQALRFLHTLEIKPSIKNGLSSISTALVFQLRAIDKMRLKNRIGELEAAKVKELDLIIKKMLKL